jgi:hypothetical protein
MAAAGSADQGDDGFQRCGRIGPVCGRIEDRSEQADSTCMRIDRSDTDLAVDSQSKMRRCLRCQRADTFPQGPYRLADA